MYSMYDCDLALRTKPSGVYRHQRDLGLYKVGYNERKVYDPNMKLAIHAKESPIWTRGKASDLVPSRPISPTHI